MVKDSEQNGKHICYLTSNYYPNISVFKLRKLFCQKSLFDHFRAITTISYTHPYTRIYFRSHRSVDNEKRRHKLWYIIHPFSSFNYYWSIFMSIVYILIIPLSLLKGIFDVYFVHIHEGHHHLQSISLHPAIFIITFIKYGICTINMVVCFFTGFEKHVVVRKITQYVETGVLESQTTQVHLELCKIAKHYLTTYFFIDFINLLDVIHDSLREPIKEIDRFRWADVFSVIIPLAQTFRLIYVFFTLRIVLCNNRYRSMYETIVKCLFAYIMTLMISGFLVIVLPRCLWHLQGQMVSKHIFYDYVVYAYEYQENNRSEDLNIPLLYLHAIVEMQNVLTQSGTVFPRISIAEMVIYIVFTIIFFILRAFFLLWIITVLDETYGPYLHYYKMRRNLQELLQDYNPDSSIKKKVIDQYDRDHPNGYFDERMIKNLLSENFKYEMFVETAIGIITNCSLFVNIPTVLAAQLTALLCPESASAGAYIIRQGEKATCMYFLERGTVAVYINREEIYHMDDGEYFGEIVLFPELSGGTRTADIVAIEPCKLYRLERRDFKQVIKENKVIYEQISKVAQARTKNIRVKLTSKLDY